MIASPLHRRAFALFLCASVAFSFALRAQNTNQPYASYWYPSTILNWSPASDADAAFNRASVPLAARSTNASLNVNSNARVNEGKVSFLSTFGSTSKNPSQGAWSVNYNAITFWQYINILVFWGGSAGEGLILAPNSPVIDAAHRNGVPVYGTVFFPPTAYGGQFQWVTDFLQKSGSTFPVADKLIQVARYYGFDGWFINQETAGGNSTTAQTMVDFIKYFRAQAPELSIQWYDAMTRTGSISWQNTLNSNNQMFMGSSSAPVAHNMFLNFWWGSTQMNTARNTAVSLGLNPYDIYAGIDVEANGYGTSANWDALFPSGAAHKLSIAFYGGQWNYSSSSSPEDFQTREIRFWSGDNADPSNTTTASAWKGLANYIPAATPLTTVPFVTNFNRGQGRFFNIDGTSVFASGWNNLSMQDVLPTWRWIVASSGTKLSPSLDLTDSYYGGGCLKVSGTLTAGADNDIKLYQASLPVSANTKLRIVYKTGTAGAASRMQVAIAFENAPATFSYLDVGAGASSGWNTKEFDLGANAGKKIAQIGLRFSTDSTDSYTMKVGQIAVLAGAVSTPQPPSALVAGAQQIDAEAVNLRLKWTHSPSAVHHYNVYLRDARTGVSWLGSTPNNALFVPIIRRFNNDGAYRIEIEAVAPDYGTSARYVSDPIAWPDRPMLTNRLTGTIIGTSGSYNNNGLTKEKAMDGDPSTYFDSQDADNTWVGLDLGAATRIVAIRYFARSADTNRMVGGIFQGSNQADFSGAVTIANVPQNPGFALRTVAVTNSTAFRYVRYVTPSGGHCNIAELAFYGPDAATAQSASAVSSLAAYTADNLSSTSLVSDDASTAEASGDSSASFSSRVALARSAKKVVLRGHVSDPDGVAWVKVKVNGRLVARLKTTSRWRVAWPADRKIRTIQVTTIDRHGDRSSKVYRGASFSPRQEA